MSTKCKMYLTEVKNTLTAQKLTISADSEQYSSPKKPTTQQPSTSKLTNNQEIPQLSALKKINVELIKLGENLKKDGYNVDESGIFSDEEF